MRKSWRRFWFALAVLIGGLGAFVYDYGNRMEREKFISFFSDDFTYPDSIVLSRYSILRTEHVEPPSCELKFGNVDVPSMGDLIAKHCVSDSLCALLVLKNDITSCPAALMAVMGALREPCAHIDSTKINPERKGPTRNTQDTLYRMLKCGTETEWVADSVHYIPGDWPIVTAFYKRSYKQER